MNRAQRTIETKRAAFDRLVDSLIEQEEMTGQQVREILSSNDDETRGGFAARPAESSAGLS